VTESCRDRHFRQRRKGEIKIKNAKHFVLFGWTRMPEGAGRPLAGRDDSTHTMVGSPTSSL